MATKAFTTPDAAAAGAGIVPLVGRIMIAFIFVMSGVGKLAAPAATVGYIGMSGLPLPQLGFAIALLVELGGGLALAFGYRTRIAAGVLSVFSIVTAIAFHHDFADKMQMINFMKNVAMAGGLLFVLQAGAGRISLDARR